MSATETTPTQASAAPALLARLAAAPAACWIGPDAVDDFLAAPGDGVLFLWSDPVRFPECLDVAVVLPEVRAALGAAPGGAPRFRIGVVSAAAEVAVAQRFGAIRRPSLVFVRDGRYTTTLAGMHDWEAFVSAVGAALDAPAARAPSIGIAVVAQGARGCAS